MMGDFRVRSDSLQKSREALKRYATSAEPISSALVKSSNGLIHEIRMIIVFGVTTDRFLMVFDQPTEPVNGAVPVWRAFLPAPGNFHGEVWDGFEQPMVTKSGIALAISTTAGVLTLPDEPEAWFSAVYE
jgi:hypothetical protein